jgi:hypothetical protein
VGLPFPSFPELPDDDPIRSLRMFREYAREVMDSVRPYELLASSIGTPIICFAFGCLLLGFERALSWASDLVPLTFAVISVLVSVKKLRDEHQNVVIAFVLVVGFLGSLIMHFSRVQGETQHHNEINDLKSRMGSVADQNGQLLKAFLAKAVLSSQDAELERRQNIQKVLRGEYILSHDNINPGLLTGTELPPADWINKRLRELGEQWTVATTTPVQVPATPVRSYLVFDGSPYFAPHKDDKGQPLTDQNLQVGDMFGFNFNYKQIGPNPVEVTRLSKLLYVEPDYSPETQKRVIEDFKEKIRTAKIVDKSTSTFTLGQSAFSSAFAATNTNQVRIVTQDDLNALHAGTEIVVVIAEIVYEDNKNVHHARLCMLLQPPATFPGVWATCTGEFAHSD